MNKSESITELAKALTEFQGEVTSIKKDSVNPFFKSKYAGLTAIWDAIRPLLKANGLSVIQGGLAPQEHQDDQGDWWTGILQMETTILHSSGEWLSTVTPMKPKNDDPQGMGSAITYARRYSLCAMLGIVADEDDDAEGDKKPPKKEEKPAKKAEAPKTETKIKQGSPEDNRSHWCEEHKTEFYMTGKMRSFAHAIEGSDHWCHEHTEQPKKKQSYPDALLKEISEAAVKLEGDGISIVKKMAAAKFGVEGVRDLSEEQAKTLLEDIKSNIK